MKLEIENYVKESLENNFKRENLGFVLLKNYTHSPKTTNWIFSKSKIVPICFSQDRRNFQDILNGSVFSTTPHKDTVETIKQTYFQKKGNLVSVRFFNHIEDFETYLKTSTEQKREQVKNLPNKKLSKDQILKYAEDANKVASVSLKKSSERSVNVSQPLTR